MRAVCAKDKRSFAKHSAVISYFRREYIKTEILPQDYSDFLSELFTFRGDADYDVFYKPTREVAEAQIANAETILNAIKNYLEGEQI